MNQQQWETMGASPEMAKALAESDDCIVRALELLRANSCCLFYRPTQYAKDCVVVSGETLFRGNISRGEKTI